MGPSWNQREIPSFSHQNNCIHSTHLTITTRDEQMRGEEDQLIELN
jgi:hypothetical protein